MKVKREEVWPIEEWSCMHDTRGETLLTGRIISWLVSGILVLGSLGALMGAITGALVQVTGEQVLLISCTVEAYQRDFPHD